jgi:hypothetical protein
MSDEIEQEEKLKPYKCRDCGSQRGLYSVPDGAPQEGWTPPGAPFLALYCKECRKLAGVIPVPPKH